MKLALLLSLGILGMTTGYAQQKALVFPFEDAAQKGIPYQKLDSVYQSAVHSDRTLAVFKTPAEQLKLQAAYASMLQALGKHLAANGFKWEKPARCFNRIYFRPDGKVDYFLYHFLPSAGGTVSTEKAKQFEILLDGFLKEYTFPLTAPVKFAQCSPVTYSDAK